MRRQFSSAKLFLWLFVITLGIVIGGGLYETLVVMPLWASAPPESVIAYYQHNVANPQFTLNQGGRFWIFVTPLLGLLSILTLLSGFRTRPEHRVWRITATVLTLIVVISTFAWFVPNIIKLTGEAVTTMNPDEITSLTNWWSRLNWLRAIVYSVAWLAALRALTVSPKIERLYN
jgi:hypothetical protein